MQVAGALETAHAAQVLHRDIKPSNIFLVGDQGDARSAKLLDFGVAKYLETDHEISQVNSVIGTPAFMAPEQFVAADVGPHADLWALAVVVYRMATGHLPHAAGPILEVARSVVRGEARPRPRSSPSCRARSTRGWRRRSRAIRAIASPARPSSPRRCPTSASPRLAS